MAENKEIVTQNINKQYREIIEKNRTSNRNIPELSKICS